MTDRVEEIEEHIKQEAGRADHVRLSFSEAKDLLSEIQRLRKVEEAARDFVQRIVAYVDALEARGAADEGDLTLRDGTKGARSFLSNALEQPEPVTQEMER